MTKSDKSKIFTVIIAKIAFKDRRPLVHKLNCRSGIIRY